MDKDVECKSMEYFEDNVYDGTESTFDTEVVQALISIYHCFENLSDSRVVNPVSAVHALLDSIELNTCLDISAFQSLLEGIQVVKTGSGATVTKLK